MEPHNEASWFAQNWREIDESRTVTPPNEQNVY